MQSDTSPASSIEIVDLLNRRTDLSTFVVHLTRDTEGASAADNLRSIIEQGCLRAMKPFGLARHAGEAAQRTQRVVCFTETPLEHIYSQVAPVAHRGKSRGVQLQPYGVAFTKVQARRHGVNPVWYVDTTPDGREWRIANALGDLRDEALKSRDFGASPIARILPFIEEMSPGSDNKATHEFWWEREWRHVDDLRFHPSEAALYLCPQEEIEWFEGRLHYLHGDVTPRCIDPRWGVEQIVAHLAGLPSGDISPLSS